MADPMVYIGDGVYALWDGYGIWLHANDHARPTDRIYLEPNVLASLVRQVDRWREEQPPAPKEPYGASLARVWDNPEDAVYDAPAPKEEESRG